MKKKKKRKRKTIKENETKKRKTVGLLEPREPARKRASKQRQAKHKIENMLCHKLIA